MTTRKIKYHYNFYELYSVDAKDFYFFLTRNVHNLEMKIDITRYFLLLFVILSFPTV